MNPKPPKDKKLTHFSPEDETIAFPSRTRDETVKPSTTQLLHQTDHHDTPDLPKVDLDDDSTGFLRANEVIKRTSNARVLNNRFVLKSVLGAGGMGMVYKAVDLRKVEARDSDPMVAVKVLGGNFKDHPDAFMTMQREARKSQSLSHPNIVRVHDFDRDVEKGVVYMTMEYMEGIPLDKLIKQHASGLPREMAYRIIIETCEALKHAHENHLIHSDLKPGNIFVTQKGVTKVLDFGIARAVRGQGPVDTTVFDVGSLGAMTPAYASLEMIQRLPPHASDDIYALACVAYVLLTGIHPFMRLPANEAKARKLKPKRISHIPRKHWRVLEKALAFDRKDRVQSMDEVLDILAGRKKFPMIPAPALVTSMAALGGSAYYYYIVEPGLSQAEVEKQAHLALQKKVGAALDKAKSCMTDKDYTCALTQANAALNLDEKNSAASALAVEAQKLLDRQAQDDHLKEIAALLDNGSQCLDKKNYDCAKTYAQQVLSKNPENTQAGSLLAKADKAIRLEHQNARDRQTRAKARQAKIAAHLKRAGTYLNRRQLDQAEREVKAALKLEGGNVSAISLREQIKSARQQMIRDDRQVKRLLAEGEQFMKGDEYQKAIGNAKAALQVKPGYRPALRLMDRAKAAERKALNEGFKIE